MRTKAERISPGCPYCNNDHDPGIECRFTPDSIRFQISGPPPRKPPQPVRVIRDAAGNIIAVHY